MNREKTARLVATFLTSPVLFYLLAYFDEGIAASMTNFISFLLLAFIGGLVGGVYAYYAHTLFIKNSVIAGFIPAVILIVIVSAMDIDNIIVLGDLCLIVSSWSIASEVASIKNKTV